MGVGLPGPTAHQQARATGAPGTPARNTDVRRMNQQSTWKTIHFFQEPMAEGLAMQHRFAAEPIFSKTGKGFLISEGVANSPAFGQFGFRLEMSRTGPIQASVG